jgi:hypothetical protein
MDLPLFRRPACFGAILLTALAGAGLFMHLGAAEPAPSAAPAYTCGFEDTTQLPAGWVVQGNVSIDSKTAYKGSQSLVLARTPEEVEKPCSAQGPSFPVKPGLWDVSVATKSDLKSPDESFDGTVTLEYLDASGKQMEQTTLADVFSKNDWQAVTQRVEIPKGAASAQFMIELHKTTGQFWVDELSAAWFGEAPHKHIDRLVFSTASMENLLYPTDSRVVHLKVRTFDPLPENEQVVTFVIRDYWDVEQMAPVKVQLQAAADETDKNGTFHVYEGSVDLAGVPLEPGKFYKMWGEIPQEGKPFRNYSGLAIEPEAVTNVMKPEDAPFTGRNWDGRMGEGFTLSNRLGIRIMNLWSGWDAKPPYQPHAPCIELAQQYHMGVIFGVSDGGVEHRTPGWQKYDEAALRGGIDNLIATYGNTTHPIWFSLGNEPPVLVENIPDDVKDYAILYDEIKKKAPDSFVIGTSIGPTEEFFKGGFGKYCDAYDFHNYDDFHGVTEAFDKYHVLFKKYGDEKPIVSTEIGLNCAGVALHTVSTVMAKKYALFFAGGGTSISWFDLFYPDPDAKIAGSNAESFDVFDSRYVKYNPKLTAITDYDMINSIANKKFVAQKQYGSDTRAFLFRDQQNHSLQILWKEAGREDVFLPLPDAQQVQVVKLDGTHRTLNAGGKGVTLTINEDPVLLLYDGSAALADTLGDPSVTIPSLPDGIVLGGSADVTVALKSATPDSVNLVPPPFWQVTKTAGQGSVSFHVTAPAASEARAAEMTVTVAEGKSGNSGELYLRLPVTPQISTQLMPVPLAEGRPPAVRLVLKNNGVTAQNVTWEMSLVDQMPMANGGYEKHEATQATLAGTPKGQVSIDPGATQVVNLPLAGIDSQTVYHVRSVVTDATGAAAVRDRNVAGFVAVPKVKGEIKLDGVLDEADWKNAPVERIDEDRQYFSFDKSVLKWKGPSDLSATIRYLWDDSYFYVGVEVTDDVFCNTKQDGNIWAGDGLQFLIDPCRGLDESVGKYDYFMGVGKKGPQVWCGQTADAGAPSGEVKDIIFSPKRKDTTTGAITYEIAFPWSRLAPFRPGVGADLGLTMALNEDDGKGRRSFMSWFGNVSSKQVETAGDLILTP